MLELVKFVSMYRWRTWASWRRTSLCACQQQRRSSDPRRVSSWLKSRPTGYVLVVCMDSGLQILSSHLRHLFTWGSVSWCYIIAMIAYNDCYVYTLTINRNVRLLGISLLNWPARFSFESSHIHCNFSTNMLYVISTIRLCNVFLPHHTSYVAPHNTLYCYLVVALFSSCLCF